MEKMRRRMFLGTALIGVAATVHGNDRPEPEPLTEADWKAIAWGKTAAGLEAGLQLVRPKATYQVGDHVELAAYLRNRAEKPITFTYYPALREQTVTITDAAGKRVFVSGIAYLGLPTSVRVTLAGGETLVVDHPGFWLGESGRADKLIPYIDKSVPGPLRVTQEIGFSLKDDGRKALESRGKISTTPQVILSAGRKPRRVQADVVGSSQEDLTPSLATGEIKVILIKS